MADLRVVAVIKAKSGSGEAVGEALAALVAPTRAEPGCRSYELFESVTEPGTFFTIESWRGQEDIDGHMQTPHVAGAFAAAGEVLAAPPVIHSLQPVG